MPRILNFFFVSFRPPGGTPLANSARREKFKQLFKNSLRRNPVHEFLRPLSIVEGNMDSLNMLLAAVGKHIGKFFEKTIKSFCSYKFLRLKGRDKNHPCRSSRYQVPIFFSAERLEARLQSPLPLPYEISRVGEMFGFS